MNWIFHNNLKIYYFPFYENLLEKENAGQHVFAYK